MADSLIASESGLKIADAARKQKGWTKFNTAQYSAEYEGSEGTLKRFWAGKQPITRENFLAICAALGVNWENVVHSPIDLGGAPDISFFVGRTEELESLKSLILEERCPLITIYGMGGDGENLSCNSTSSGYSRGFSLRQVV